MALSRQDLAAYLASARSQNKIHPRPSGSPVPLSFGQEQLWLHSLVAPELPLYNETVTIRYQANLSVNALEQSLNEVVRRHEIYRTSVRLDDGIPFQEIAAWEPMPFRHVDLREWTRDRREDEAIRLATESARKLFDFSKAPLLRALVVTLADDDHRLFLTLHHLVFDGVAIRNSLLPELIQLYSSFSRGQPSFLPAPELQYGDYAYWQRKQPSGTRSLAAAYWKSQLSDLPSLTLPVARPRVFATGFRGAALRFELNQSLVGGLRARCFREQATFFNLLLAGFLVLLSRYSDQADFGIGTVSAGRSHPEFEALPGYFLSTIVLRTDLSGNPDFQELLARVQQVTVSALSHAEVPFMEVVRDARPTRDKPNPLVQVMFSMEPPPGQIDPPWELVEFDVENGAARIDLHVEVDERPEQLTGRILYNSGIYEKSAIEQMLNDWETLLQAIAAGSNESLWDLPLSGILKDWRFGERQDRNGHGIPEPLMPRSGDRPASGREDVFVDGALKNIEDLLEAMWCELLDVDHVGRDENFFDLGGHSLLGARFLSRVAQKFKQGQSFIALMEAPTIAQFAALLHGSSGRPASTIGVPSRKKKLLWIGTNAWLHRLTSLLGDEHPVHNLTLHRAELEPLGPAYKMEELADVMLRRIRELQPEGPYFLGGFCLSALLAYECAQQLRSAGSEVPVLILTDAVLPGPPPPESWIDQFREKMGRVSFHLSTMGEIPLKQWGSYIQGRMELLRTISTLREWQNPVRSKKPTTRIADHLVCALCAAHVNYDPLPYEGKALVLQSGRPEGRTSLSVPNPWETLLPDSEVYHGPPGHIRLFDPPYVELAAERIRTSLNNAVDQFRDLTLFTR
jgi:thioesterase domain-containing protein/aryl carrier-like protein